MTLIAPPDPALIAQGVKEIIEAVGQPISIEYVSSIDICPTCAGTDPFCPTCAGNRTVDTIATLDLVGTVKWKQSLLPESKKYRPEGQYLQGDCLVIVAYDADSTLPSVLDRARRILVSGRYCIMKGYYFRGSPSLNRIYLVLNEDSREDDAYRL